MPLEVIGAGFGRTGTTSLQEALEILYSSEGKHCYHFFSIITRPQHARQWISLVSGETKPEDMQWDDFFEEEGFVATQDHPSANFYPYLLQAYPNAKVILSRHPNGRKGWYQSKLAHQQIYDAVQRWPKPLVRIASSILLWKITPRRQKPQNQGDSKRISFEELLRLGNLIEQYCWGYKGIHDEEHALAIYDSWYAEVPKVVPKEKLLEYDVSMGWEPLCKFLNKPIPNIPFPKETAHNSANITSLVFKLELMGLVLYFLLFVLLVFAVSCMMN